MLSHLASPTQHVVLETLCEVNLGESSSSNSTNDLKVNAEAVSEVSNKDNLETESESPNKKSTLTCDTCGKKFFKLHRLEGHLRQHQGLKACLLLRSIYPPWYIQKLL